ncbi:MAG: hypothetical protein HOW73_44740 [Polyangiaceae bacterium]|nr:hypothetical protein [Polyangiaceae bacterium]
MLKRALIVMFLTGCAAQVDVESEPDPDDDDPAVDPPACETIYLAGDGNGARDVALDETHAYWTDGWAIFSASIATGEASKLFEGAWTGRFIAIDDSYVYSATEDDGDGTRGALFRIPKGGGPREEIGTGIVLPIGLEVSAGEVFVLDIGAHLSTGDPEPTSGRILRWNEATDLVPMVEGIQGYVGELMVDAHDVMVRRESATQRTDLLMVSRADGAMTVRSILGDRMALAADSILLTQDTTSGWSIVRHQRASGGNTLLGTVAGSRPLRRILATDDHAYFALNNESYEWWDGRPQVIRMALDSGIVEHLPYDEVEGTLTAHATNHQFVAFGRTQAFKPADHEVVLFCR